MKIKGIIQTITKKTIGIKTIFHVQLDAVSATNLNKGTVECVFFHSKLNKYMPVEMEGELKDGRFFVSKLQPYFSRSDQVARYMESKIKGCGIGKKRIQAIIDQFGADVFTMTRAEFKERLENELKAGISEKSIVAFLDAWFYESSISALEVFLSPYEIKYTIVEKINEEYKTEAVRKIKEDPYKECLHFDIKRQVAESMAKDLKIDAFDRRRVSGLISYTLQSVESEGHTYIKALDLEKRLNRFSLKSPYRTKIPKALISLEIVKNRIFDWDPNNNYIAFTSTKNEEINSSYRLRRINDEFKSGIVIEDSILEEIEKELNITLSENQRNAFKMLESGGVNILTGGPGTGKTTIAKGIILYFQKKNPGATVLLCAPTGRAAKRLSESTNMESKTAHKLLEFKPFQGCEVERNNNNPLEADFIIADEGSMFDIHLFNMLLNAIPKNCRLLLIGDENQLPSVGAGNCLHDMIESNLFGVYRLTDNFRSDSSIKRNSDLILNGEMPQKDHDFNVIKARNEQHAYNILSDLMDTYYKKEDPFYCQMIEASKKGAAGCDAINAKVHKMVHQSIGPQISDELMINDKIMFIRNEYKNVVTEDGENVSTPLYTNGEIVTIQDLDDDEVVISDGYEERALNRTVLSDAKLCYSYTIHKSQGSEYNTVIIYLSGDQNVKRMMNRNLLYTAVTRAKKKVIIVYTEDALESCIKNEFFVQRRTRMSEYLRH